METKPYHKSNIIQWGAAFTVGNALIAILAFLDQLTLVLDAVDLEVLPEDLVGIVATIAAVGSALTVILRLFSSQPIAGTKAARQLAAALEITADEPQYYRAGKGME